MGQFEITTSFNATCKEVYGAWLSSRRHTAMTGGTASCSSRTGGSFTAWDGYISGLNLKLVPYEEIVQTWRTTEFSPEDDDSRIQITLKENGDVCELTLKHTNIPDGQPDYESGWEEHYFRPMRAYFG